MAIGLSKRQLAIMDKYLDLDKVKENTGRPAIVEEENYIYVGFQKRGIRYNNTIHKNIARFHVDDSNAMTFAKQKLIEVKQYYDGVRINQLGGSRYSGIRNDKRFLEFLSDIHTDIFGSGEHQYSGHDIIVFMQCWVASRLAFAHQIQDIKNDPIYNAFPAEEQFAIQFDDVVKMVNHELKYEDI